MGVKFKRTPAIMSAIFFQTHNSYGLLFAFANG
ncbi:hypothetical protein SAMN00120144_2382 [Hymenobacter roseosalivarius DSM 11622]|uniref:Uncharacterized protein n=1 Tax=Hymenobacter roseosalivarius DSM 11622 TaxID=645990 RepID=A0A1W1UYK7_9BACT|nr:hypothetical protein SAMN00120144_2382 [Hymenobacter roseosalivarius DSM 11622]